MSKIFKSVTKVFKKVAKVAKKILPIVLAVAAIVFTGGAALGLTGTFLGASLGGGFGAAAAGWAGSLGLGATATAAVTGAITYAGYGAVTGGAIAGVTGGDINKGMQSGALTGAVTGGVLGGAGVIGVGAEDALSKAAVGYGSPSTVVPGATSLTGTPTQGLLGDTTLKSSQGLQNAGTVGNYTIGNAPANAGSTLIQNAATESTGLIRPESWLQQNGTLVGTTVAGLGTGLLKGSASQDSAEATLQAERERRANLAANYALSPSEGNGVITDPVNKVRYSYDPRQGRIVQVNT